MISNKKIKQTLKLFKDNYEIVPLEIFEDSYKVLISTVMSARTNDDTTLPAAKRLFEKAPDINSLNKLSEKEIVKLIYPVGFYKTKAKNIKKLTKKILEEFSGEIPNTREELMTLPGVGRKTANLVLNRAFNKPAIAVDTHVHRICNILGWVKSDNPEETERQLIQNLPQIYWSDMNRLFVSIGRQYRSEKQLRNFLEENNLL